MEGGGREEGGREGKRWRKGRVEWRVVRGEEKEEGGEHCSLISVCPAHLQVRLLCLHL